ncbi:MAG: hypothetical protein P1V34_13235 [Alphaproteobacteria bacterium]|nr:hypothetical protein [Alphaproteobacteria bacterium]
MSPVLMDFTIALGFTGIAALMLPLAYAYFERVPAHSDVSIRLSLIAFMITVILAFAMLYFVNAAFSSDNLAVCLAVAALGPVLGVLLLMAIWKLVVPFVIRSDAKEITLEKGSPQHLAA